MRNSVPLFVEGLFLFMAISRQKKEEVTQRVSDIVSDAETVVFVNFHKLPIADEQGMRATLKEEGVGYYVAKKTLVKRALEGSDTKGELPALEGELAIAYSTDQVAPAREVQEFAKKHKEQVTILGGIFDGEYKDATAMREIAAIPGMQQLRGMFANVINSPVQGLVMALDQIAKKKEA